jgi:hypothetical protein
MDGFFGAYWRRPAAYLDPAVRAGMSSLRVLDPSVIERGIGRLHAELADGTWQREFGELERLEEIDLGYRLLLWERV